MPSAVTYAVRKLEDALDVLLFDRSGHRAQLIAAGQALLDEGRHLLRSLDDLACRVKRIATGWEMELRVAVSAVLPLEPLLDLVGDFQALNSGTSLRLSEEVLSGAWDALAAGRADLIIGADASGVPAGAYHSMAMGQTQMAFCVAPQHPLARLERALTAQDIAEHTAIVVADTSRDLPARTRGLLPRQSVIVMPTMRAKLQAQIRGLGCGYLPLTLAAGAITTGQLMSCPVEGLVVPTEHVVYAWRPERPGQALAWWLEKLRSPRLCESLLGVS
ncbi:LysR family transcriptional regulator [Bordetella holmesii]|uniref:LysR substrate-binding domain protein n=2 Tax=Bordetella holmesii TaxID=35814 RepID=A0A158M875_9BORD|nr:bacterial regulatory helix-turn-helix, lysR family protein [Bordetella holmesii 44057]AMD46946.1 LysR family transcriptional regulator [Bordetella holmesii H558]AOB35843.1 LysR family transcriptional regulator [Bordetella holmesii]EWM41049.1 bacterial regulatory helix-turn-helix, lysR family protein [Bordetella holmesii 35009]EWM41583.1 bacterial regulatory helix-turn-helix, lysR family protein [Bordetella holmesii 41130]EWM44939.1 bacterial regulatory helix-turn-helix, lysR family protein 